MLSEKNLNKRFDKFLKKAKEIHGNKYNYDKVIFKTVETEIDIFCNNCKTYFKQIPYNHINRKCNCTNCAKNKKINTKVFTEKSNIIHNNKYDYSETIYEKTCKEVIIICKEHGPFKQLPNNHLIKKCGCPQCNDSHKKDANEFIQEAIKIHKDKYIYDNVLYINSTTEVQIYCKKCKKYFSQQPNVHLQNHGCQRCKNSKGEIIVERYLKENNFNYTIQKTFNNCKHINKLRFDFYLVDYNICIEYDGRQHFQSVKYFGGEKNLKETQIKDRIKDKYCINNNIKLIRINYKENIIDKLNSELFINNLNIYIKN